MTIGIVLLAMVAAFLALRLYSVLGKRTGHEQTYVSPPIEASTSTAAHAVVEARAATNRFDDSVFESQAAKGIRDIVSADSNFDVGRFVEGSKSAYRMILEAFWRNDEDAYAPFVDADVKAAFAHAIEERKAAGHVLDNRLVTIEGATITDAKMENGEAFVTVRFDADIAAVTRDSDGTVIAGSLSDAVPTHDMWTFSRHIKSNSPDWLLVETEQLA